MHRRRAGGNVYIRVGGRKVSSGTPDRERARRLQDTRNAALWDDRHGLVVPVWERMVNKFLDDNPALEKKDCYKTWGSWWLDRLAGKRAELITPKLVNDLIMKDREGVSLDERTKKNSTANQYVSFVNRVIRHCTVLKPAFQHYPPMLGDDRWVTPEEWARLTPHWDDDTRDTLTFILATGLREANAMWHRWAWEKRTWGSVPAGSTKTAVAYGIPYNATAQGVIERRRQLTVRHPDFIFMRAGVPWKYRYHLLDPLAEACEAEGIEHTTVHHLRDTFGTWLARCGVSREVRERLMMHRSREAHDRYIHFDVEYLRPYSCIIDEILAGKRLISVSGPDDVAQHQSVA